MDNTNHEQLLAMLDASIGAFHKAAADIDGVLEPVCHGMRDANIKQRAKLYQQLEYLLEITKELSRQCNVQQPLIADSMHKHMEAEGLDSIVIDGYKYTPDIKTYVSVTSDDKPTIMAWLKTMGNDGRELVREDFNANSFSAYIKSRIERGEDVHPAVKTFDKPMLSVRKAGKK